MGTISSSIEAAYQNAVSKHIPVTIGARVRFLLKQEKLDNPAEAARSLALKLGCHPRTVERYRDDKVKKPKPEIADKVEARTRAAWQPLVRKKKIKQAATGGARVEMRARWGFTAAPGTTNDPRMRRIAKKLPATYIQALFDAHAAGASESELEQILSEAMGEAYFTDGGARAQGLTTAIDDLDYVVFNL